MIAQELPKQEIHLPEFHTNKVKKHRPISDNLILTIIFILGFVGTFYILSAASTPSTVNSQGYTIEYSSISR
jgi:hypothetical protein